jgi:hypothetical protein
MLQSRAIFPLNIGEEKEKRRPPILLACHASPPTKEKRNRRRRRRRRRRPERTGFIPLSSQARNFYAKLLAKINILLSITRLPHEFSNLSCHSTWVSSAEGLPHDTLCLLLVSASQVRTNHSLVCTWLSPANWQSLEHALGL